MVVMGFFIIVLLSFLSAVFSLPETTAERIGLDRDELIRGYFWEGATYLMILNYLSIRHGINISLSYLKKILRRMGLKRNSQSNVNEIRLGIQAELRGSGANLGYRSMCLSLRKDYGLSAPRQVVARVLRQMDAVGVESRSLHRRRRQRGMYWNEGPNSRWHMDGYDKLSIVGIYIHGCIDGFSRRILWLEAGQTNRFPSIVAGYFVSCLRRIRGLPTVVRSDCGSETTLVSSIQQSLRHFHADNYAGPRSYFYGTSPENTRIEGWWSFLRRHRSDYWINFFKGLIRRGLYTKANPIEREALKFCFMPVIQMELNRVSSQWNVHSIRKDIRRPCPEGKPNELYFMPQLVGARDHLKQLNNHLLDFLDRKYCSYDPTHCSPHYYCIFNEILLLHGWRKPLDFQEALTLYLNLIQFAEIIR